MNPSTPALHIDNIAGSPGSSWAGLGLLANSLGGAIAQGGLPTSTAGWVVFGLSTLGGLFGIFGR